jgi:hypothetical protein
MRDYINDLDQRLAALAAEPVPAVDQYDDRLAELAVDEPRARHRRAKRAGIIGSITVALTALVAGITLSTTSMATLPIFDTPTQDASSVKSQLPRRTQLNGILLKKAHPFDTPAGKGFVMFDKDRSLVCVVLRDAASPPSEPQYGQTCKSPLSEVERDGLQLEIVGDLGADPKAVALSAFVLPKSAEDVRLRSAGATRPASVQAGVVVTSLQKEATLLWTVDGKPFERLLEGPFPPTTGFMYDCGNGRMATVPAPDLKGLTPSQQHKLLNKLSKHACDHK